MVSSQAPTSVAIMTAAFPPMVAGIVGEPILQDLIRLKDTHMNLLAWYHVCVS